VSKGTFTFVLHGHLPYVISHGRWPHGTDWLCEAAAETYLPIIRLLNELVAEGYQPKLTMGISPVLAEQLGDASFKDEFVRYLNQKTEAARHDIEEFTLLDDQPMLAMARHWRDWYGATLDEFNGIGQDILFEFKKLSDADVLEIITCGATHGYYPLLSRDESLEVQTKLAVSTHKKHFGKQPRGIWLPECAYRPRYDWMPPVPIDGKQEAYPRKGVDEFLSENGIDFFIIDSALLKGGKSVGVYIDRFDALKILWNQFSEQYKPRKEEEDKTPREAYLVSSAPEGKKPVAIFTRDPETGLLVWSGEHGYPGDGHYLDFHKKRFPGGLRYWAVTSAKTDLADKVEYVLAAALDRTEENSDHFVKTIEDILENNHETTGQEGILVAPYDAELFGHWWYEGPTFLKKVLKKICDSKTVDLTHLSDHLDQHKPSRIVSIPEGSWGEGNNHFIWLNEHTAWTWKHIYESEATMCELARSWVDHPDRQSENLHKVLLQAGRELLLMSASDWQFLISTWAARDYAELRLSNHYSDFKKLAAMARKLSDGAQPTTGEWNFYEECHKRDSLFDNLQIEWFAKVDYPVTA
jgi:1,4-alpha-glucan branching enzyme